MRRNVIFLVLALVLISVLFFLFVFRPQSNDITETREAADAAEQRVRELRTELERLQALQAMEADLRARAVELEAAMPTGDPQLAQFILQLQESADDAGIEWLSVSNSLPAEAAENPGVLEVNISLNIQGGYFQVQDYLVRLESLARAVKIGNVSLSPVELPTLNVSMSMKMFLGSGVPAPAGGSG